MNEAQNIMHVMMKKGRITFIHVKNKINRSIHMSIANNKYSLLQN